MECQLSGWAMRPDNLGRRQGREGGRHRVVHVRCKKRAASVGEIVTPIHQSTAILDQWSPSTTCSGSILAHRSGSAPTDTTNPPTKPSAASIAHQSADASPSSGPSPTIATAIEAASTKIAANVASPKSPHAQPLSTADSLFLRRQVARRSSTRKVRSTRSIQSNPEERSATPTSVMGTPG